jgi:hypothetical protein
MHQHHTIGKLLLELQLPGRENAMPLQEKLGAVCKDRLVAALQELLDSWADKDTLLRIDRLEIDLGACTPQLLEKDLPEMVLSLLRDRYPSLPQQHAPLETGMQRHPVTQGYFDGWLYFLERGLLPDTSYVHDTAAWEAGVLEILATASTAMEKCRQVLAAQPAAISRMMLQFSRQFIHHWLQAYAGPAQQPVMQVARVWEHYCYEPGFLPALRASLPFTPPSLPDQTVFRRKLDEWSIQRILSPVQVPEPAVLLEEVMKLTFGNSHLPQYVTVLQQQQVQLPGADGTLLSAALASLQHKYEAVDISGHTANAAEAAGIPAGKGKENNPVAGSGVDNTASPTTAHKDQPPVTANTTGSSSTATDQRKDKLPVETGHAEHTPSTSSPGGEQVQEGPHAVRREASQPEHTASGQRTAADTGQEQPAAKNLLYKDNREEQRKTPGTPPEGLTTYISNAGLVLLHPYLQILFNAVGLLEKRAFKSPAAQDKAVQLLAFLACGETGVPEYELVLPKLLCGLLPEDPVDRFVELSETDKTEANQLLAAVIENWSALGSASPDGLRGNFLMREGKLQWQWDEWRLRVTQQSYDLLLNRLPWGISVIRLPWMPWVLKTEWA